MQLTSFPVYGITLLGEISNTDAIFNWAGMVRGPYSADLNMLAAITKMDSKYVGQVTLDDGEIFEFEGENMSNALLEFGAFVVKKLAYIMADKIRLACEISALTGPT